MAYVRKTIDEHTCPECGGVFYIPDSKTWVYKRSIGNKIKLFCSWTCYRKCEKKVEARKKRGERIGKIDLYSNKKTDKNSKAADKGKRVCSGL